MAEFTRPGLYAKQEVALFSGKRFSLIEATSKCGKTVGAIVWIIEKAITSPAHRNFWWVAPIFDQADIAYRRMKQYLTPGSFSANEQRKTITLLNQVTIWFKTADNPDSLYGEDVYGAVVDEASRVKEEAWFAVRSTLSATLGEAVIIGNVKGKRNWFYNMARLAESMMDDPKTDMHYAKLTIFDAVEGGVMAYSEIEALKRQLPEAIFKELYLAEPGDDFGNPFGDVHIRSCFKPLSQNEAVAWGVDLARKKTWYVLIGLDMDGNVCYFDRWQRKPWKESAAITRTVVGNLTPCLVDATGIGDPFLETLQDEGYDNFEGFMVNPTSKQNLMEGLAISIQTHELGFPEGPITAELQSFTYEVTRTGIRYEAPDGLYDDCVFALALARHKWKEVQASTYKASYASRGTIQKASAKGRTELQPNLRTPYTAFFSVPGSTTDRPSVAIAHLAADGCAVLDYLQEWPANKPLDETVQEVSELLARFNLKKIMGDKFAGEWPKEYFSKNGVFYHKVEFTLAEIYRDFMPLLSAGQVELLDNPRLLMQLNSLERSVTRAGRDSVVANSSDNLARAVAAVTILCSRGNWATWQKLAANATRDGAAKREKAAVQDFATTLKVVAHEISRMFATVRKARGGEVPDEEKEEAFYIASPTSVQIIGEPVKRTLPAGRWIVPKGTRVLNKHIH